MGINRYGLERTVEGRWFALADFTAAVIAAILLYFVPGLGGWPLLLAISPWLARLSVRKFPFRRTIFDIPLGIFMITALVGVWAAYDQEFARTKFWILTSAVLLFYSAAGQPGENLWPIGAFFVGLGTFAAAFFLMGHDWIAEPLKIGILNRLGESWMSMRPNFSLDTLHPNSTGALIGMFSPFAVAVAVRSWRERRVVLTMMSLGALVLMVAALIMTTSRGAWIGLTIAASLWVLWLIVGRISSGLRLSQALVFAVLVATMLVLGVVTIASVPSGVEILADSLPGPSVGNSRLELMRGALALIEDFPFTGGGLGAFPGLFSQYFRVVPFFLSGHSHNLFLNVSIEQGLLGALALMTVMLGSLVKMLLRLPNISREYTPLLVAALIGLFAVLVHGLVDDVLYALAATPMLLLLPGFGVAPTRNPERVVKSSRVLNPIKLSRVWIVGALLMGLVGVLLIVSSSRNFLRASWFANLGAIEMANIELAGWPTGAWEDGSQVGRLASSEGMFSKALGLNPTDRTANHRMGLILMLERDYEGAIGYLETAYMQDPEHRGIRKALGQSYVWTGQPEQAYRLLASLPESRYEMDVYAWWWGTQNRPELAKSASKMVALFDQGASATLDADS